MAKTYSAFCRDVVQNLLDVVIHRYAVDRVLRIMEESFGGTWTRCTQIPDEADSLRANFVVVDNGQLEVCVAHPDTIQALRDLGCDEG